MGTRVAKFILAFALIAQFALWSQSRYGSAVVTEGASSRITLQSLISRRWFVSTDADPDECAPILLPQDQQCAHVEAVCDRSDTFLGIQYLESYYCAKPSIRPLQFFGLVLWLIFLFSFIGITASDFFCPNLATIALIFGLDENVAGVTFLAFGNGSPDLFATFAAMRANSGSLAIGELLGAASFIISVVAGSMCIVRPFRVNPRPFFRDVGFFTVAVSGLLFILIDGVIRAWEAACLAGLYLLYVLAVASSWWGKRREETQRRIDAARNQFAPDEPELEPYHDEEPYQDITPSESSTLQVPQESRPRAVSNPVPPKLRRPAPTPAQMSQSLRLEIPPEQIESARNSPHSATAHHHLPSFSLMGALEFRSVVTSFQRESSISSLDVFNTPISPYAGGHYDRPRFDSHSRRSASSRSRTHSTHSLALDTRPHSAVLNGSRDGSLIPIHDEPRKPSLPPIPRLSIQPPEYFTSEPSSSPDTIRPPWGPSSPRLSAFMSSVARTLFPTLRGLGSKTFVGKLVSFLAAPAVLLLTLTLPVVVTERHDAVEESASQITVTAFDDEEAEERAELAIEAEVEKADEWHPHDFNKYLIASQCALGPLFCVGVLFGGTPQAVWWLISTAIVGISSSVLVLVFADDGKDSATRLGRCLMGFVVSMVWIMAIADEVVQVLTAVGLIFGLSDAIIGLTVFAVGNSMADFVANFTVAAFAPIMGFSACFGGPMLNIMLGIGLSGSLVINQTGKSYVLEFSHTLLSSSIGLLCLLVATMIWVPYNNFMLTKGWGIFLIATYAVIMSVNVCVEIYSKKW